MSIPVSKYEELLRQMRGLGQEARQVQSLASPLLNNSEQQTVVHPDVCQHPRKVTTTIRPQPSNSQYHTNEPLARHKMEKHKYVGQDEDLMGIEPPPTLNSSGPLSSIYHGSWTVEKDSWQSGPSSLPTSLHHNDSNSVMSFASSAGSQTCPFETPSSSRHRKEPGPLDAKVDIVYGLLAMLGSNDGAVDMGHTLLALSSSPESCMAMRKSGCIPLLVQLVHSNCDPVTREQANEALHNLVQFQPDDRLLRHETRVLKLLEQIRVYANEILDAPESVKTEEKHHPSQIIANLMKLSFDEGHRMAICQLGGLQAIAKLIQVDHLIHGSDTDDPQCITLRRYSGMALTNLTFGDSNNKALLCSLHDFMKVLVKQLYSNSEDLKQVTASVLRNLSWRADLQSKQILREANTVAGLAHAAMNSQKESTLKSILSGLWNLSSHCSINKADICNVDGLLIYLVNMLNYKSASKTLSIVENAGGILKNISSHIAVRDDYRQILRDQNCLQILLQQLRSPSLTVVSNACGTLWNLSAKCPEDQKALWDLGAVPMLRSLTHSKHKMISMGSSAALKNLLSARPNGGSLTRLDSTARALGLTTLPTLCARKQRALEQELDQNLSETCENIEPNVPDKFHFTNPELHLGRILSSHSYTQGKGDISESRESVTSTHSDSVYERVMRSLSRRNRLSPQREEEKLSQSDINLSPKHKSQDSKYLKRYKSSQSRSWYIKGAVRAKYSDEQLNEQPIDYSQKYSECLPKCKVEYGDYAITDLDQPTNYSLRYPDDEDESKIKVNVHEDTLKTYCTEGTPYETPFNFSTATSMSDLRLDNDKKATDAAISTPKEIEAHHSNEKETCSTEDITKIDEPTTFSSGIISPEKPVNYCEEGTPGYFSRVSSLSSLNSMMNTTQLEPIPEPKKIVKEEIRECKVVTFGEAVNYAQETPLMFSRSSSLASLDSVEQHSIHDDRSSVISDFSRRTSGVVSPSELPDSPTQTVPPTPRVRKITPRAKIPIKSSVFEDSTATFKDENTPIEFSRATSLSSLTVDDDKPEVEAVTKQLSELTLTKTKSVRNLDHSFGPDALRTYCTEDTPAALSHAGSNSNLSELSIPDNKSIKLEVVEVRNDTPDGCSNGTSGPEDVVQREEDDSSNNSADELLLQQCIQAGMNRVTSTAHMITPTGGTTSIETKPVPINQDGSLRQLRKEDDEEPAFSDDSYTSADERLLQQCIKAGMARVALNSCVETVKAKESAKKRLKELNPKKSSPTNFEQDPISDTSSDDSTIAEKLLQDCIEFGIQRVTGKPVVDEDDNASITSADERLLTECINLGIQSVTGEKPQISADFVQQSKVGINKAINTSTLSLDSTSTLNETEKKLLEQCIRDGITRTTQESKNGNGTPVAVTGVKNDIPDENEPPKDPIVNTWIGEMKNGYDDDELLVTCTSKMFNDSTYSVKVRGDDTEYDNSTEFVSCIEEDDNTIHDDLGEELKYDYCKPRDPDAMIASVDRLTAELVSQASVHYMKQSGGSTILGNTYTVTTDTTSSTGDLTFPTVSASTPILQSIKSEEKPVDITDGPPSSVMTESTIIANEAANISKAIQNEGFLLQTSITSCNSLDLEHIQPPSIMGSLVSLSTNSASSPKMIRRKLSANSMMRRAITNSSNYTGSLENLHPVEIDESTHGSLNLDQIQPPSLFNDLVSDMESSMISVASINSEIVDETPPVPNFLTNGLVNVFKTPFIDSEGPPSFLNHDDSDTICESLPSSSIESSPTRKVTRITPKQRRQQDRFKTYTVNPEEISSIQDDSGKGSDLSPPPPKVTPKQRRLVDRQRFQTQVLTNGMFVPVSQKSSEDEAYTSLEERTKTVSGASYEDMIQHEASRIVNELEGDLETETLSLISNEESSEPNSVSSVNYRTYHKSWKQETQDKPKPKITKPVENEVVNPTEVTEEAVPEVKAIRGRRKPLYSGIPARRPATKLPPKPVPAKHILPPKPVRNILTVKPAAPTKKVIPPPSPKKKLERQGTFTKEDPKPSTSKIAKPVQRPASIPPASPSKIPKSRIPAVAKPAVTKSRLVQPQQRSYSNSSIQSSYLRKKVPASPATTAASPVATKDVTSKIANLWKKVNQSKLEQGASKIKDKRVWIQNGNQGNSSGTLIRSSTFDGGITESSALPTVTAN